MRKVIKRRIYDTELAELVCYTGILNKNQCTRCKSLYKTSKGSFFIVRETMWQGEYNEIIPYTIGEAETFFQDCPFTTMTFEEAFPNIQIEEA